MNNFLINKGAEIFKIKTTEKCYDFFNGAIRDISSNCITNYNIKMKLDNKYVSVQTNNLDNEEEIYNQLMENSKYIENDEEESFATISINNINYVSNLIDESKIIDIIIKLSELKNENKHIKSIRFYYAYEKKEYSIQNKNINSTDINDFNNIYLELALEKDGELISSYDSFYFNKDEVNDIEDKIRFTINQAIERLEFSRANIESKNIILNNNVVSKIMETFIGAFYAEEIKNSLSPLCDKINTKVFSDKITIVEDPISRNAISPRYFDNEGNEKSKQTIVNKGKFIKMLNDNKTAKFYNQKLTGNKGTVRNLHIIPGKKDIYENLTEGYVITNIEGMHSGINKITGDISVQGRGYIIKDNKKIFIENLIITTSIFEILNNVIEVGNDLKTFSLATTMPSLLLENISIVIGDK